MRSVIDKLVSWTGLTVAVVLLVAGGLLTWASSFTSGQVAQQLRDQNITMPAEAALTTPDMKAALSQYAGQPMTTGDQARAYADHYILAHMNASSDGRTYAQVSSAYQAAKKTAPDAAATQELGELRQTLFMGSTLRGLLLNAYAYGMMAKIAMYAAVAAFVGAAVMFLLGLLGLRHARIAAGAPVTLPREHVTA